MTSNLNCTNFQARLILALCTRAEEFGGQIGLPTETISSQQETQTGGWSYFVVNGENIARRISIATIAHDPLWSQVTCGYTCGSCPHYWIAYKDVAHKHKMNSRALQLISQWCMLKPSENDKCCLRNSTWSNSHRHAGDTPRKYFYCHKKLHICSDLKMLLNLATLIAITDYLSTQKRKLHFKWKPQQA